MSKKRISYIYEWRYTVYSIVKGLIVTFVNLFRKKVTLQYPEVKWDLPEGYRGMPTLPVDETKGADRCIACQACVRACPTQLITVDSHMGEDKKRVIDSFTMNIGLCMFCGMCEEVCPVDAIRMSDHYELASFTRDELLCDRAKLNQMGGVWPPAPERAAEPAESGTD